MMAKRRVIVKVTSGRWIQTDDGTALEAFAELKCGHTITTTWGALYRRGRVKNRIRCPRCSKKRSRLKSKELRITTMKGNR